MENPRRYGHAPFSVAVIHGGPGAGGEMAPVARKLAAEKGVLEPIQTATTLDGQVEELASILEADGAPPVTLIGHSWGAWLSFILAARRPELVKKLILVSSGPFEEAYVPALEAARRARLTAGDKDCLLERLGALAAKTDAYDPIADETADADRVGLRGEMFDGVWRTAAGLRRSGELLGLADRIACPVVAVHGADDPHPAAGVEKPLAAALKNFRFILLKRCGHMPWLERQAREEFFSVLRRELK
ncbi:MAG: alpha/beta hydrolase [Spirochaetales bacterium]|nr:alpha/beta hydrolase [Spirochaetales bacterium]